MGGEVVLVRVFDDVLVCVLDLVSVGWFGLVRWVGYFGWFGCGPPSPFHLGGLRNRASHPALANGPQELDCFGRTFCLHVAKGEQSATAQLELSIL